MSAQSLETEFNKYWSILNPIEKASLLTVAKNYVHLKQEAATNLEEYNKEIDAAVKRVRGGKSISNEKLMNEMDKW